MDLINVAIVANIYLLILFWRYASIANTTG